MMISTLSLWCSFNWFTSIFTGILPRLAETIEEIFPKQKIFHENQKISESSDVELNSLGISELYAMLSDIANEETGNTRI